VPTIRVFEALACGIALVSAPWEDIEGLFTPGRDYLVARDGAQMRAHLRTLLNEPQARRTVAACGRRTVAERHSCDHRARELLEIHRSLNVPALESPCPR
jgi:spore maturation protein CgeB